MADSPTEDDEKQLDPTERRLERAREDGQFPQSKDLTAALSLILFVLTLAAIGPSVASSVLAMVAEGMRFGATDALEDRILVWASGVGSDSVLWLLILIFPLALIAGIGPLLLVRLKVVFALKLKLQRLDPIAGLKRIFSVQTTWEALKNLAKVFFIFSIGVYYVWTYRDVLQVFARQDTHTALQHAIQWVFTGLVMLMVPLAALAVVDIFLQQANFKKRMKMSYEEVKQELKETEGSPEARQRQRQRQREVAQARMMSAVERADVVIVNPEHYAVALRYDGDRMNAPVVVAKGIDEIALRIRTIAREHQVPIARTPPLARLIHGHVKVGKAIPPQLFEAVAKVMAWAYESKRRDHESQPDLPELGELPSLDATR